jgi:hypothetical protein
MSTNSKAKTQGCNQIVELSTTIPLLQHLARQNLQVARQQQERSYDLGHHNTTYKEGNEVLLYFPIHQPSLSESLLHHWMGPYLVVKRIKENTYLLQRKSNGLHATAHVMQMKKYFPPVEAHM